jgi:hypothetical protein
MPIRFVEHPVQFDQPAPLLGTHNEEITSNGWAQCHPPRRVTNQRSNLRYSRHSSLEGYPPIRFYECEEKDRQ